jgi:autophagy-related protein 33
VSYTLSSQSLPSLLTLPSAKPAAYTLNQQRSLSTLHIRALSTVATLSLLAAFGLSPPRIRHPYLLWTALVAAGGGVLDLGWKSSQVVKGDDDEVNGDEVEKSARDQQFLEFVRTLVAGTGFAMGVVGIWGDGA